MYNIYIYTISPSPIDLKGPSGESLACQGQWDLLIVQEDQWEIFVAAHLALQTDEWQHVCWPNECKRAGTVVSRRPVRLGTTKAHVERWLYKT